MEDVTGKTIEVGDTVVTIFDEYAHLTVCEVVKITPQKVGLVLKDENTAAPLTQAIMKRRQQVRYKYSDQIAKV